MMPEGFNRPSTMPGNSHGVTSRQSGIFDILPSGLVILDAKGVMVYANSAAARLLGVSRDRLLGALATDPCRHGIHEDGADFPGDQQPATVALRTAAPVLGCVMGMIVPGQGLRWLHIDAVPTLDQVGRPTQVVMSMTDVTAHHTATERAGRVYGALSVGVVILDGAGRVTEANASAQALLGASKDDLLGRTLLKSPWRGVVEDAAPGSDAHPLALALVSGQAVRRATLRLPAPGGGTNQLQIDAVPLLDEAGAVEQVVVSYTDVTARVTAERALRASEKRLAHAFNEAALGMAQVDDLGKMLHVNPAMSALLGYAADELVGMLLDHVLLVEAVDQTKDLTRRSLSGELDQFQVERRFVRKDGQVIWVRLTSRPVRDRRGRFLYFVSQFEDITARMRIRHAMEELARLRADQVAQAEAQAAMGTAVTGVLDRTALYAILLEHATRLLPGDQAIVLEYENGWAVLAAPWGVSDLPVGTKLFPIVGADAPWLPANRATTTYLNDTATTPDWVDFPPWVGCRRIRAVLIAPFVIDGVCVGALCLQSFTPDRYTPEHVAPATLFAERMSLALRGARLYAAEQARAGAAEELVVLRNEFVATVSHELRSPLTAILGYGELLQAYWKELTDEGRLERVGRIVESAHRQQRLVSDLLLISKLEVGALRIRKTMACLGPLVAGAVEEVRATYRDQRIELRGPDDLWVLVDGERLTQIVVNLADNAAKYSPENTPITIEWRKEESGNGNPSAGLGVILRVTDRGSGVPTEGRERLFERFGRLRGSRSRAGHVGTGLGLYLSRRLAEAMGGALDMESTGPSGTVFRLRLPHAAAPSDYVGLTEDTGQGAEHDSGRKKSRGARPRQAV